MRRCSRWITIAVVLMAVLATARAAQQSYQERRVGQSAQADQRGLAEPFKGVTAAGSIEPGLFAVRSTGCLDALSFRSQPRRFCRRSPPSSAPRPSSAWTTTSGGSG